MSGLTKLWLAGLEQQLWHITDGGAGWRGLIRSGCCGCVKCPRRQHDVFTINADTSELILRYLVRAQVKTAGKQRKGQKSNTLNNSSYSHKIKFGIQLFISGVCVVIPCFQPGAAVQSERALGDDLAKERRNCWRYNWVIATFIIATFQKKKNDPVSSFSPFASNTACIKATRHKEPRCLSTRTVWRK